MEDNKILQELIRMHSVRIGFYHERIQEMNEIDHYLTMLFAEMGDDSKRYRRSLVEILKKMGETPEKQNRLNREGHQWKRFLKNLFCKRDRASVLIECEFLEETLQSSYRAALDAGITHDETRQLIVGQQQALRMGYENIRFLIDSRQVHPVAPFEWSRATARHLVN